MTIRHSLTAKFVPQSVAMGSVDSLYCDTALNSLCFLHNHLQNITCTFGSSELSFSYYLLQKHNTLRFTGSSPVLLDEK